MKNTLLTLVATLALTAFGSAHAAPQVMGDAHSDSVQIKAPDGWRMQPQDFQEYAYSYRLSNDETVRFTQRVAHYYAQVGGEKKVELFAVAPGVFVTATGARVEFQDDGYALAIHNYERLALTQTLPAGTTMVAGR
ncbi:MAG: hypothetical protein ACEQSK_11120 [Sphingomonadaceae bacterium]